MSLEPREDARRNVASGRTGDGDAGGAAGGDTGRPVNGGETQPRETEDASAGDGDPAGTNSADESTAEDANATDGATVDDTSATYGTTAEDASAGDGDPAGTNSADESTAEDTNASAGATVDDTSAPDGTTVDDTSAPDGTVPGGDGGTPSDGAATAPWPRGPDGAGSQAARRPGALLLSIHDDNEEMRDLAASLGYEVREVVVQHRRDPDVRTFLGTGKIREVARAMGRTGARVLIVNDDMRPGQIFRFERELEDALDEEHVTQSDLEGEGTAPPRATAGAHVVGDEMPRLSGAPFDVLDRVRVILEIFRRRARSQEARLQVELARLRYEVPLVREAIHLARTGEHPGFLAGGAYGVDQYYERIRRRMRRIRQELQHVSDERSVRRKHRRRGGFHLISLAGYTNAGKSSLLEALTDEETVVEDRMFSTVATRTRRMRGDRRETLLTDTVGFIEDLPPWLVEAFHSTLEEIALADVILLVVDASDPPREVERKLRSSLRTLDGFAGQLDGDGASGGASGTPEGALPRPARHGSRGGGRAGTGRSGHRGGGRGQGGARGSAGGAGSFLPRGLAPTLLVLNKRDRLTDAALEKLVGRLEGAGVLLEPWVAVSARTGANLRTLEEAVVDLLPDYDAYEVVLPQGSDTETLVAWIHENADLREEERGEQVYLRFEAKPRLASEIRGRLEDLGARILDGPPAIA